MEILLNRLVQETVDLRQNWKDWSRLDKALQLFHITATIFSIRQVFNEKEKKL